MIEILEEAKVSLSRDVHPKYPDPFSPDFKSEDWGRPVEMIPSDIVRCDVHLSFFYDKEPKDRELVDSFLKSLREILSRQAK